MNRKLKCALAVSTALVSTQAAAQLTFYEWEGFRGRALTVDHPIGSPGSPPRCSSCSRPHGAGPRASRR